MEKIYSRDNYNVSYKRFSKTRRRPGRPPSCNIEPPVNCFVCDEKITRQKVNLVLGSSSNKSGFPSQISQLLGDEFLIIVQEDDYLCKHCVSLFNNMDKLERQLSVVKDTLLCYLKKKYNLANDYDGKISNAVKEGQERFVETRVKDDRKDDDDVTKQLNDLHSGENDEQAILKCNICEFNTNDKNEYDKHVRSHITFAMESEYSESSSSCFGDFLKNNSSSLSVKLFKCSICFKMYVTRYKCIEHMKNSHVIDKSVVENNNDELFNNLKRKSNSKLLKKLHSRHNAYYCNNCFRSFSNESEFNKHNCNNCMLEDDENVNNINNSSSNSNFSDINFKNILKSNFDNVSNECNSKDSPRKFSLFLSNDSKQNVSVDSCSSKIIKENNSEMFKQNNRDDSLVKGIEEIDNTKNVPEEEEEDDDDDDDDIGAGEVDYASHDEDDNENGEDTDEMEEDDDDESDYEPMKHVCGNCGFRGDLVSLREHFFEVRPQRDLVCSICGQSFNSYCKLIKHSNGHDINSKPYDCIYCDNTKVPDLLSLNYHMKKTHLNLIDEKVCNLCNQNFPNLDYLNKHMNNKCCLDSIDVNRDCENNKICCDDDVNSYNEKFDDGGNAKRVEISHGLVEVKSEQKVTSYDVETPDQLNFSGKINKNSDKLFIFSHKINENMDEIKSRSLFQSCRPDFNNDKDINDIDHETKSNEKVELSESVNELPLGETLNVVYKCGICGVHRNSKDELLTHFENHTSSYYNNDDNNSSVSSVILNENKYICHICNVNFNDNLMLKQHAVKHSNIPQNISCLYCNENFHDELNLKYHIIHVHSYDIAVLYCNLCKSKSHNVLSYKQHLIYKHKLMKNDENNNYYCKKCNRNFNFKWKLLKHYCKYHKNEFKCRFCDVVVKNFKELIRHDKLHFRNGNNMYKCDVCYRLVKSKSSLNFHKLRHTCELNLYCRICELSFIDISTLNEHINIKHNNMDDLYSCNKCGKSFKKYSSYKIHRLSHENEHLLYECKLCHLRFSNMSLRAIHKRKLHKNQYPLNCNICSSFNTNRLDIYRRHFNLHCKKSQYNCKKCLKIFTDRHKFIDHKLKIHNNKERLDYINYKKIKVKPDDVSELNYNINGVDILLNNYDDLKNNEGKKEQCCQFLQNTNFMR